MTSHDDTAIGRRGLLATLGAATLAAAASVRPAGATAPKKLPLTAQTTEGPYYLDLGRMRRDITEGLDGVPLEVRFNVCDTTGKPLPGLRVDIWHCDMQGRYSGFGEQGDDRSLAFEGKTFLRGSQLTDREGVAAFATIYPGWYAGRTTHIHMKVLDGTRAVLTSQFFLPDALSEFLYTQVPLYQRTRVRDTLNSVDGIALKAGDTVLGAVREERQRYVATLALVVDPAASPAIDRPPPPAGDMPPRPQGMPPMGGAGGAGGGRPMHPRALAGAARLKALVPPRTTS
ncbi:MULTISPECIES: intradiol ring-cleavage dioxygenase [Variovorax]|uniref:Protocatechuate 3,4-dioxygenase beta subunit n=1 Tax=Variovorax guangxiensis TaxID=1775474 RepID=A0A840G1H5_9BURK|nr:intradiol ring-cleavage dioxygenase [Variovorax guangxiensis]MBB4225439.1 protocatechuate 3,4-dioxygenase beta subunit [Variovorax guangxiensis]